MSKVTKVCIQRTLISNSREKTQETEFRPILFPCFGSPYWGQDVLIVEASRLHSDIPHSVGILWTSDRPITETFIWQNTTLKRERETSMPQARFEAAIPARQLPQTHALERAARGIGFQRRSSGIALVSINLGATCGWVVNAMRRRLYPQERGQVPIFIGVRVGLRATFGRARKISPPTGFDPRTVQPVTSRYSDWAIPAHTPDNTNANFNMHSMGIVIMLRCGDQLPLLTCGRWRSHTRFSLHYTIFSTLVS
jgi:hypothetical protein